MARIIDLDAVINSIRMKQQMSHPASADAGYEQLYIISGANHGGLFVKDSAGRQIGPFITGSPSAVGGGALVQKVGTETGAVANGTTIIPVDDTIPQNTEGVEFMTLAITPTDSNNILYITVTIWLVNSAAGRWLVAALFQDTTANALAAQAGYQATAGGPLCITLTHKMTAGTTSATTFKVRGGSDSAGTIVMNGDFSGARLLGGVIASSITIEEVTP